MHFQPLSRNAGTRPIGQLVFLTRNLPSVDYTLGAAASGARSARTLPLGPCSERGSLSDIFLPPLCGRCPEGNTQVDQVSGWLVGGREADEHGDSGDGSNDDSGDSGRVGSAGSAQAGAHEGLSARGSAQGRAADERGVWERVSMRLGAL